MNAVFSKRFARSSQGSIANVYNCAHKKSQPSWLGVVMQRTLPRLPERHFAVEPEVRIWLEAVSVPGECARKQKKGGEPIAQRRQKEGFECVGRSGRHHGRAKACRQGAVDRARHRDAEQHDKHEVNKAAVFRACNLPEEHC